MVEVCFQGSNWNDVLISKLCLSLVQEVVFTICWLKINLPIFIEECYFSDLYHLVTYITSALGIKLSSRIYKVSIILYI